MTIQAIARRPAARPAEQAHVKPRLVCRWHRDPSGKLVCRWALETPLPDAARVVPLRRRAGKVRHSGT